MNKKLLKKRLKQIKEMIFVCERTIQLFEKDPSTKKREKEFLKETRKELRGYRDLLEIYNGVLNGA